MSFPYDQYTSDMFGQQQDTSQGQHPPASFPQWEALSDPHQQPLHSPLDTPGSGTLPMQLELDDLPIPSPIDNTPILLHHPHENPPPVKRHGPTTTAPVHPIDAVIFGSNRPRSAASAPASTPPGAAPSPSSMQPSTTTTGVVRNPPRAKTASATAGASHPYYRPQTTGGGVRGGRGTSTGTDAASPPFMTPNPPSFEPLASAATGRRGSAGAVMTRSKTKKKQTAISATTPHGGMIERPATRSTSVAGAAASSSMPSPTVRQSLFASSPHFVGHDVSSPGTPQVPQYHPSPAPPTSTTTQAQPSSQPPRTQSQSQAHPNIPRHRLKQHTIPSDMHYSLPTHMLTCSLELPGVLPQHIRVSLATCFFNHVKYVAVSAESVPPFPEPVWGEDVLRGLRGERLWGVVAGGGGGSGAKSGLTGSSSMGAGAGGGEEHERLKIGQIVNPNMRERRFGFMRRMIQVPAYTTTENISATLKNGVLTLTIDCGKPFEQDDEQEVSVSIE